MTLNASKIRVGLIGFGVAGKYFHAPLLKAHGKFEIVKVLSSREDEVRESLPNAKVVREIDEINYDQEIDLVINTAPNKYHFSYSQKALEANKNVVVEKPFVIASADGEKLISLAKEKNKILTVFQNRRWDSDFLTVKKLIDANRFGEIKVFESYFDRLRPVVRPERWREQAEPGAGILYDLGAHLIDQALCLFGPPDDLIADVEIQRTGGVSDDYFHLTLKYQNRRVILRSSSLTNQTPRFVIQGTKGIFVKYGFDPQEESLKNGAKPTDLNFGLEKKTQFGVLTSLDGQIQERKIIESERGRYLTFYDELYDCLVHRREFAPVKPESSLEVIRLIERSFGFVRNPKV